MATLSELLTDSQIVHRHELNREIRGFVVPKRGPEPVLEVRIQRCGKGEPFASFRVAGSDEQFREVEYGVTPEAFEKFWQQLDKDSK